MLETFAAFPAAWRPLATDFLAGSGALHLAEFLQAENDSGQLLYPPVEHRFAALEALLPDAVKVVVLGQDPYHGPNQAMGLSFSVPEGQAIPPSLRNIYRELATDVGLQPPTHGDLTAWARQGVLLLNSVLSVRAGAAGSHAGQGWETLTDQIVHNLAHQHPHLVFMLWGSHAQRKAAGVDAEQHLILRGPHPSPLSAYRGFWGGRYFSRANEYLQRHGKSPIDWTL